MTYNELILGEKIETILSTRSNGLYGKYLGATAKTFGACAVGGVVYKVERNIEINDDPMWVVRNMNDNTTATAQEKWDLASIREEDFE